MIRRMETLDDFLTSIFTESVGGYKAVDNVDEDVKNFYAEYKVPGYRKDEIDISYEGSIVKVKGESEKRGSFESSFSLPKEVSHENIEASLEDGILTITLPKREPSSHRIAIT